MWLLLLRDCGNRRRSGSRTQLAERVLIPEHRAAVVADLDREKPLMDNIAEAIDGACAVESNSVRLFYVERIEASLLNGNHPRARRAQSAAHECGHVVSTRRQPEILHKNERQCSREELYAAAFGRAFLMPVRTVMQKFHDVTAGSDRLSRRHVIVLAHFFGVSREAMVRRLEELKLVKPGTWDWFYDNGGITDEQERQVLGDLSIPDAHKADADRPTTLRLNMLAAEAYRRDLLSEGQLARLLHLDRVELRRILDGLEIEGSEGDGLSNLLD